MRQVVKLAFDTWDAQARSWGHSHIARPTWPQVEETIRAIDPASSPVLTIILNEEDAPEMAGKALA
jgi:hypothetical protein